MKKFKGASMIEYVLIAVLISIVAVLALTTLGSSVQSAFTDVNSSLSSTD